VDSEPWSIIAHFCGVGDLRFYLAFLGVSALILVENHAMKKQVLLSRSAAVVFCSSSYV
jgi:hypothetical protein